MVSSKDFLLTRIAHPHRLTTLTYTDPRTIHLRNGEVVLYRRNDSPLWHCRFKLQNNKWHRVSTKRASIEAAVVVATDLYDEARYRQRLGLAHQAHDFAHIAKATLDELRTQMDAGIGKSVYKSYITCIEKRHLQLTERAIQLPDALGLGLFTALGTQIALGDGLSGIAAVLMGVISAVFGGVLRDVFCNEIPKAFSDHQPYALCALLGGSALVMLQQLGLPDSLALIAAFGLTSTLRVLTILRDWRMPGWRA